MTIDTNTMVSISEANQNFSKVARLVDERGFGQMRRLSKEQILMLHTQLIEETGGSDGVRDYNLLESALE